MREPERSEFGARLFKARKFAKLTQAQLSKKAGGPGQSTIAELELSGMGSSHTAQLANACGVRPEWLSDGSGSMLPLPPPPPQDDTVMFSRGPARAPSLAPILAWEHEDELPPGEYVMVPRLEVKLSAGDGREQVQLEFNEAQPQAFRADWLRGRKLKPKKLAAMTAQGNSMEPAIYDSDSLLVDTGQVDVQDGKVYALWYEGGERVKRLYRLPGGGLRIRSDNAAEHPEIVLGPEYHGHVRIIGRVVLRTGAGGL